MKNLCVLIMAVDEGAGMASDLPKAFHTICGTPMIRLAYRAVSGLGPDEIFVIGKEGDADRVRASLNGNPATFIPRSGAGHPAMAAREPIQARGGDVLLLSADMPLLTTATLQGLVEHHRRAGADISFLSVVDASENHGMQTPPLSPAGGEEAADGKADGQAGGFTGICCCRSSMLELILEEGGQASGFLIDDPAGIRSRPGCRVETVRHGNKMELLEVRTRLELAETTRVLQERINMKLMASGVTLLDPERTYVDFGVIVGKDVTLHPLVTLQGNTTIGGGSVIHSGSRIANSVLGSKVLVNDNCVITDSEVGSGTTVGPCAHLRGHTRVGEKCRVGNFVEIKKSTMGDGSKAAHLAYLGDAVIGRNVNIGAGVITCNYDGVRKYATIIEDDVFVGTDSQLIAPLRIGRGAYVAAGSCVTEDVPPESLAIARSRQTVKEGWARRRKESNQS